MNALAHAVTSVSLAGFPAKGALFLHSPSKSILPWVQGIVGSTPWSALVFFTLWLQLLGFSDFVSSTLMAVFACGTALGTYAGGLLGVCDSRMCSAPVVLQPDTWLAALLQK